MSSGFLNWRRTAAGDEEERHLPGLVGPPPLLPELENAIAQAVALVGEAIAGSTHALLAGDRDAAKSLIAQDEMIDELVATMIEQVEHALMESGRSAAERRALIAILRMLPEIERNGDLAEHIARRAARGLGQEMSARSRGLIERMGEVASAMWRDTANAIGDDSGDSAAAVEDLDDELDDLHVTLTAELTSGTSPLPIAIEIAMVARFYERFGDHCVNLARRVAAFNGASVPVPSAGGD